MRINTLLIAPDSFKGSLSATQVANIMAKAVRNILPRAKVLQHPISDGGEGFTEILLVALGGSIIQSEVAGPLPQQRVTARWGLSHDQTTAIIAMASAAGLPLAAAGRLDPKETTTFGVGEIILRALDRHVRSIIIGLGGSATNDGGAGMAEALGIRFLDAKGEQLPRGGLHLKRLHSIDVTKRDERIGVVQFIGACDVNNVLSGPDGASVIYGPQKGADPDTVGLLDDALAHFGSVIHNQIEIDVSTIPGGGAAGGLGAGLVAFCGAELKRGIDVVLDVTGFNSHLEGADVVLTGEGRIDAQHKYGKAITGIVQRARTFGVPVVAVAGTVEGDPADYRKESFLQDLETLVNDVTPLEQAISSAAELVYERTQTILLRLFDE